MSKMLRVHQFGNVQGLKLDEVNLRPLRSGEAKIAVKAAGITRDNLNFIKGNVLPGQPKPQLPATFGYEAAGTVQTVGAGVDPAWIGKRVAPIGPYDFLTYGSVGDEIIVPAERLVEIPAKISFEQAAALWIPYLTAFPVVEQRKNLPAGAYVLITAATSTVGHAAIQYAQNLGLKPIGTTRSAAKAKLLQQATGIKNVIVTSQEDLNKRVQTITHQQGVSLILDPIGGSTVPTLAKAAAPGGIIIEYGVLGGLKAQLPVAQLLGKGLTITGFTVDQISAHPQRRIKAVNFILDALRKGQLKPLIAAVFPLNKYRAAFDQLQKNDRLGRVILTC